MQQAVRQSEVASLSSKKEKMLLDKIKQTQKRFHYVLLSELSKTLFKTKKNRTNAGN